MDRRHAESLPSKPPNSPAGGDVYRFKAFISYSHAADSQLSPALQSGLQRLAKPWYRRRAMRVFRDKTGLAVTPELWGSIQRALETSEYFILLASPAAAQSGWVQQEVEFWLAHRPVERLLIVLTEGDVAWDANQGDFDWSRTNALPRLLEKRFPQEPNFLDLRWARASTDLSLRQPRFLEAVAGLAATLRNVPLDNLIGDDVAQYRTTQRLLRGAVVTLVVLTLAALYAAYLANQARNLAGGLEAERVAKLRSEQESAEERRRQAEAQRLADEEQKRKAEASRRLAVLAGSVLRSNRELSTLLAIEAVQLSPTPEAEQALRQPLLRPVAPVILSGPDLTVTSARFSPDGQRVLGIFSDGSVRIWVAAGPADPVVLKGETLHSGDGATAVFGPDGSTVLTAFYRGIRTYLEPEGKGTAARIWDARTGQLRRALNQPYIHAAAFRPDGKRVVTGGDDQTVLLWDAASGGRLEELKDHEDKVVAVEFSEDGLWLATASQDGTIFIRGAQDGKTITQLNVPGVFVDLDFSPDGRRLVTISNPSVVRLWDWRGAPGSGIELRGHTGAIYNASFSRDSRLLVTASADRSARIWEVATGRGLRQLGGHDDFVYAAEFSPDGRWIVTASVDGKAILWEAATGKPLMELGPSESPRTSAVFSSDGKRIAIANVSGQVMLYSCDVCGAAAELLTLARSRVTRPLTAQERAKYLRGVIPE